MAASVRLLPVLLSAEDHERLRLIADKRNTEPRDLAAYLITSWLAGPGRTELIRVVLGDDKPAQCRPGESTGQLKLVGD
jgi:hypothetical protein